jgi:hypothetical protein
MAMPVLISDGERLATIDPVSRSLQSIDHPHHEIHEGVNYRASLTASVGSGNSITLTITTPAAPKQCHMLLEVTTGNSANAVVYEATALTANTGNAITPRNANRNYPDNSTATVVANATVNTTNRTQLVNTFIGQPGANPFQSDLGGQIASRHEWVLKPATSYTVQLTETGATTQLMHIGMDWYEHSPGEA